jgi:hypothetical protein
VNNPFRTHKVRADELTDRDGVMLGVVDGDTGVGDGDRLLEIDAVIEGDTGDTLMEGDTDILRDMDDDRDKLGELDRGTL